MIQKRKVRMINAAVVSVDAAGNVITHVHEVCDYVPVDLLDAYVADAQQRWQHVEVGNEHDPGPGGDEGLTHYPAHLDHPKAGRTFDQHGNEHTED